jgi:TolB-like protein/class 3 adenylate cyclase
VSDPGTRQRLAAILVADVAGYSRLMAADERQTVAALDAARGVFTAQVGAHQGRIIDMAGDSVLAVFDTATGAVAAALRIQAELAEAAHALTEDRRMRFRIGVHLGDVIEKADGTVYGDGVNIAARLESLAEPGGVMVSDAVRTAVRGKVAAPFVDRGQRSVKNIPEPVHAFAVGASESASAGWPPRRLVMAGVAALVVAVLAVAAWYAPWRPRTDATAPAAGALPLPSKPSIAVLPFENMSGEAEQAYFADGITEDLITDLSKVSGLFVIARNSTFVYKGKARDVREIAKTLGVRYVLEGSVRRSGGEIRVNAQLIDAGTGGHVWADRYDGDMKNIFGLQDKVTRSVVTALAVELTKDDRARVARRGTDNPQAYDAFLKGWEQYLKQTPEAFRAAIVQFKQAAALDPVYGRAYAALAATYWDASTRYWDVLLGLNRQHEAQYQAEQYLAKAMRDPTPLAHQVASAMSLQAQQHEEALAEARRAIAADSNDANGYIALAAVLSFTGRPSEALTEVERAMRLNPHYPPSYLYQLALARFGLKRLDEANASLERAIALNPDDHWSQRLLLATYGLLGRRDRAAKLLETMKAREARGRAAAWDPITVKAIAYWYPYTSRDDAERFAEGLRRAGVPE